MSDFSPETIADFPLDLGSGWRGQIMRNAAGEPEYVGLLGPNGCGGAIPVDRKGVQSSPPVWHLVSESPLTLRPSINFIGRTLGHGFITDGKWVQA